MSDEAAPKKWWQSIPAMLSGIGTLLGGIGAVLGFVLGSHHAESELRQQAAAAAPQATSIPQSRSPSRTATRRASTDRTKASDRPAVLKTSTPELPDPPEPALTRQPYFLALPDKREYDMQASFDRAVFMLLRAKIIPQTPESDLLRIGVRVISRNRNQREIRMYQKSFYLSTEERRFEPETFSEEIPPGQTRDINVDFYLPANLGAAKLRMALWTAQEEVALNVAPGPVQPASAE